jgi:coenzyme Q-binding protein COQ10
MPKLHQKKILNHSAKEIYELVIDIEKYPEFLPWCKAAKIIEVTSPQNLQADLLINFKNFFEKYRSNVTHGQAAPTQYFIDVVAIEGPFKSLINNWKISEISAQKCEVDFFLEFEFNSIFLTKLLGNFFERAAEKMMNAFEERAAKIHA